MADEKRPTEGTSFPFAPDLESKTARPRSVGPHHVRRDQEDPADPGLDPGKAYAAEIARNNAATAAQPQGKGPITAPTPKAGREPEDSDAPEEVEDPGKAPPVAPTPPQGR